MKNFNFIKEGEAENAVVGAVKTLKSLAPEAQNFDVAYKIFQLQKEKFLAWKESGSDPSNILLTVTDTKLNEHCSYSLPTVDLVRFPKLDKKSIIKVWHCNEKNGRDFLLFEYPFLNRRIDKVYKILTSNFAIGLNFKQLKDCENFQLQFTSGSPKHVRREVLRLFNSDLESILGSESTTRKESWKAFKHCSSAMWIVSYESYKHFLNRARNWMFSISKTFFFQRASVMLLLLTVLFGVLIWNTFFNLNPIDSNLIPSPVEREEIITFDNTNNEETKPKEDNSANLPIIVRGRNFGNVDIKIPNTSAKPNRSQKASGQKNVDDLPIESKVCVDEPVLSVKYDKVGNPLFINECDTD